MFYISCYFSYFSLLLETFFLYAADGLQSPPGLGTILTNECAGNGAGSKSGSIIGTAFRDYNANAVEDAREPGLE